MPIDWMQKINTVLASNAQLELQVFQIDVKSAFLNDELSEEAYLQQPKACAMWEEKLR